MQFIFLFCHLLRQARWHDDLVKTEPRYAIPDAYQQMLLPDSLFTATTNDAALGVGRHEPVVVLPPMNSTVPITEGMNRSAAPTTLSGHGRLLAVLGENITNRTALY